MHFDQNYFYLSMQEWLQIYKWLSTNQGINKLKDENPMTISIDEEILTNFLFLYNKSPKTTRNGKKHTSP